MEEYNEYSESSGKTNFHGITILEMENKRFDKTYNRFFQYDGRKRKYTKLFFPDSDFGVLIVTLLDKRSNKILKSEWNLHIIPEDFFKWEFIMKVSRHQGEKLVSKVDNFLIELSNSQRRNFLGRFIFSRDPSGNLRGDFISDEEFIGNASYNYVRLYRFPEIEINGNGNLTKGALK